MDEALGVDMWAGEVVAFLSHWRPDTYPGREKPRWRACKVRKFLLLFFAENLAFHP